MLPIKSITNNDFLIVDQWLKPNTNTFYQEGKAFYSRLDFINEVYPLIKEDTVLITDSGDISLCKCDNWYYGATQFKVYCQFDYIHEKVKKWYSTSLSVNEDIFTFLPLGVLPKHLELLHYVANAYPEDRKNLLYVNFGITSPQRAQIFNEIQQNASIFNKIAKIEWPPQNVPWPVYERHIVNFFINLLTSKFVLCPMGTGVDTYRLYEALYLGCIPIVEDSAYARNLKDFRILKVDSFDDISLDLLTNKYEEIIKEEYNIKYLTTSYYRNLIQESVNQLNDTNKERYITMGNNDESHKPCE